MKSLRWGAVVFTVAILGGALSTACHPTFVIMPKPGQDTIIETEEVDGAPMRIMRIFRVDTIVRIDTVLRTRTQVRVDTLFRADTVMRVDTIYRTRTGGGRVDTVVRVDTVRVPAGPVRQPPRPPQIDTVVVVRVDTVRIPARQPPTPQTLRPNQRDTVFLSDTVRLTEVDTVQVIRVDTLLRVDTVQVAVVDTVVRTDTVRLAGRRMLFVPPGHYPPAGQCRVWIHDRPPGRQAAAAPCGSLGAIPNGAFILFGGEAWDAEYDWVWEADRNPGSVPPEIIALTRPGSR